MLVKDLYNTLDFYGNIKGLTLVDGDNLVMYSREALGMTYLEYSTAYIKEFTYKNGYITVYI